jgi:hypothetical protein
MIAIILSAVLSAAATEPSGAAVQQQSGSEPDCWVDTEAMLNMAPEEFDQGAQGWRALATKMGCDAQTANLIAEYRGRHWGQLKQHELHISYWHEGQARAMAGESQGAIPLLLAGINPSSDFGFSDYALATVAFLHHDLDGLKAARARLAVLPRPSWLPIEEKWPQNLDVVDGLLACFEKPYREAYSGPCRPR